MHVAHIDGDAGLSRPIVINQLVDNRSFAHYLVHQPIGCGRESGQVSLGTDPLSRVFSALADPTRRDIVARLADGDATVRDLAEPYYMTVQAISKHLKVLEDAGLVTRSRQAQRRPVHLEADVLDLMTKWIERYRRNAEERYRRLDAVLDTMRDDTKATPPTHTGDS